MVVIDSSAWIEFLRGAAGPVRPRVRSSLGDRTATCDPVRMEVLAGARDERHRRQLHGLLARSTQLATHPADYEHAALLYRACRAQGATVRKLLDCLIAAVAIREGLPVLHADRDFDVLAAHTDLEVVSV